MKLPSLIAFAAIFYTSVLTSLLSIGNIAAAFTVPTSLSRRIGTDASTSAYARRNNIPFGVAMRMGGGDFDYQDHDGHDSSPTPAPSVFFVEEDTDTDNKNTPFEPHTAMPRPPSVPPPPQSVLFQNEYHSAAAPRDLDTASATASTSSSSSDSAVPYAATASRSTGKAFERKSVVMSSSVLDSNNYESRRDLDLDVVSAFDKAQMAMETAYTSAVAPPAAEADSTEVADEAKASSWSLASIPTGLPKLGLPSIKIPKLKMPKLELSSIEMPNLSIKKLPKLELPVLEVPTFDMPRLELPQLDKLFIRDDRAATTDTDTATSTRTTNTASTTIGARNDVDRLTSAAIGNINVGPARELFVTAANKAVQFMASVLEAVDDEQEQQVDVPQDTVNGALLIATTGTYLLSSQNPVLTVLSGFLTFYAVNSSGLGGDVTRLLGTATTSIGYTCALVIEGTVNSCIESLPNTIQNGIETTSKAIGNAYVSTRRSISENSSAQNIAEEISLMQESVQVALEGLGEKIVATAKEQINLGPMEDGEVRMAAAAVDGPIELPATLKSTTVFTDMDLNTEVDVNDAAAASFTADGSSSFQYESIHIDAAAQSFEPPNTSASTHVVEASAAAVTPVQEVDLLKSFESVASLADDMQGDISNFVKENKQVSFQPPNIDTLLNEASALSPNAAVNAVSEENEGESSANNLDADSFPFAFSADAVVPTEMDVAEQTVSERGDFDLPEMNSISDAFQLANGLDEPHMDIIRARDDRAARIKEGRRRMLEFSSAGDKGVDSTAADTAGEVAGHYSASTTTTRADLYPKAGVVDGRTTDSPLRTGTDTEEGSEADTGNGIDLSAYDTAFDLARRMDEATIETELTRLGLTIVGDSLEKARRLFLTKSLPLEALPRSLFA